MRNSNLWMWLSGLVSPRMTCFVDGTDGGAPTTGGDGGAGGGAGAAGGSTSTAAPGGGGAAPTTPAPGGDGGKPVTPSGEASLATQEPTFTLTGEGGKPERALGESSDAFLHRYRDWKGKQPAEGAEKTAEQIAAEKKAADDKAAKDAAVQETPEQKAARDKAAKDAAAAQETPEQKAAREKAEKELTASFEEDLSPVPTDKLAAIFKRNPKLQAELQKELEADGLSTDALFATSRSAHQATAYKKEFPTLESAQHAKAQAVAFQSMDEHFTAIQPNDIESTASFISNVMMPMTYMRDQETGEVLKDAQTGLPLTDGSVFTFLDNIVQTRTHYLGQELDRLTKSQGAEAALEFITSRPEFSTLLDKVVEVAGKAKDKDLGEQIKLAAEVLKERGKGGTSSATEGELPEHVKKELEQARLDKQNAAQQSAAANKQRVDNFQDEVLTQSNKETEKLVGAYIDGTTLKADALRPQLEKEIRDALYENLSNDPVYRGQRDKITGNGLTKKTHEQWVALNKRETEARLRGIVEPIIAKYGGRRVTQRQQKQATQDAQTQTTQQHEVQGGAGGAHLPGTAAPKTNPELIAAARENLQKQGVEINTESLTKEWRRLKTEQTALVA